MVRQTKTKDDDICANNDRAHAGGEELANSAQHHDHADGDVRQTTVRC